MTSPASTEHLQAIAREVCEALLSAESDNSNDDQLQQSVNAAMNHCLQQLDATGLVGPANRIPSNEFWNLAKPVFERGALQLHAREKPRGYAGDYQLLDHICQNRTPGESRRVGSSDEPDRLGRAMDVFFQSQSAPCAVRNRYRDIAGHIVRHSAESADQPLRILSFGSGPAWEVNWSLEELTPAQIGRLDVTLMDIDPAALEFCRDNIGRSNAEAGEGKLPAVTTTRVNLGRFPRLKKVHASLEKFDLVYCAGLFDYLPAEQFVDMLQSLWNLVDENGTLLAFNFSDNNPSRAYMEWIGNWYLLQRSAGQLSELADQADLPKCEFRVQSEEEGVNLFLRCQHS